MKKIVQKESQDKISHFAITTSMFLLYEGGHQLVQFSILKTGKFGWMNARVNLWNGQKKNFFEKSCTVTVKQ